MKNVAYYHLHLTDNPIIWSTIFIEQMKCLEDYGLIHNLDHMNVRCITQDDDRVKMFQSLCETYDLNINIEYMKNIYSNDEEMLRYIDSNDSITESLTQKMMFDNCKKDEEEYNILYFHSKGTTSYYNNLTLDSIKKHKQQYYWRQTINFGVLERWKDCVKALETNTVVGFDFKETPMPHFCGNFWWSKASHIRRLPDPINKGWWTVLRRIYPDTWYCPLRMSDSMWVCSPYMRYKKGTGDIFDIANLPESYNIQDGCLIRQECEGFLK